MKKVIATKNAPAAILLNTPPIRVIRQQEKSVKSMLWMLLTGTLGLVMKCSFN